MKKFNLRYWLCQLLGWGGWILLQIVFAYQFAKEIYLTPDQKKYIFLIDSAIELTWGILATHLLRLILKRLNWMRFSIDKVVLLFIVSVGTVGLLQYYGAKATAHASGYSLIEYMKNEQLQIAKKIEKDAGLEKKEYYQIGRAHV